MPANQKNTVEYFSIPIEVFANPLLTALEKNLFASIYNMNGKYAAGCFATNSYLADYNQVAEASIERALKTLDDLGYISRNTKTLYPDKKQRRRSSIKRQRQIFTHECPTWNTLADIWNRAFPQQDEVAFTLWSDIGKAINKWKSENKELKSFPDLIQHFIEHWNHPIKNDGTHPIKNDGTTPSKMMGILLDKIIRKDYKKTKGKKFACECSDNNDTSMDDSKSSTPPQNKQDLQSEQTAPPTPPDSPPKKPRRAAKPSAEIRRRRTKRAVAQFDKFWKQWPRKKNKKKAQELWVKLFLKGDLPELDIILKAVKQASPGWACGESRFIPHATTWLNGERWDDEVDSAVRSKQRAGDQSNADDAAAHQESFDKNKIIIKDGDS